MERFFKIAGDLNKKDTQYSNNENSYFRVAGSLNNIKDNNQNYNIMGKDNDDIKKYLDSIVSGKKYDFESELGTVSSEGAVIVSLSELREMVEDGNYNIIKANYINNEMVDIVYQQFNKDIPKKHM